MIEKTSKDTRLKEIIKLLNEDEINWDSIDELLSQKISEDLHNWAESNLQHNNPDYQDAAASVLQSSTHKLSDSAVKDLYQLLRAVNTDNPYPAFRAACALTAHQTYSPEEGQEIAKKLGEFHEDEDLASMAEDYLIKLK